MKRDGPIRVLIVDDSPTFRSVVSRELRAADGITVVGAVFNEPDARETIIRCRPDVIVLTLDMPRIDGLRFLRELRNHYPVPVFVCIESGKPTSPRALEAVQIGALEVLIKPGFSDRPALCALARQLAQKIPIAEADARPVPAFEPARPSPPPFADAAVSPGRHLVVVGASTGGTEALMGMLSHAPHDFPPTVIVEHMPADFTRMFAKRLDAHSPLRVNEAVDGETLSVGHAVVARGDAHLIVEQTGAAWCVRYTDTTPVNRHCPSVDVLFDSAAHVAGRVAVGILLTGMGDDGARGLLRLRQSGAITVAQDARSCVVYGMPKVAVELGAVQHQGAPEQIPQIVLSALLRRRDATPRVEKVPVAD